MKPAGKYQLVLATAPDLQTARKLARAALKARLIACANLVPGIESHYWWQGKMERGTETLLILKTTAKHIAKLQKLIIALHPYDTPEFIVISIVAGHRKYLDWLEQSCRISR